MIDVEMEVGKKKERENSGKKKKMENNPSCCSIFDSSFHRMPGTIAAFLFPPSRVGGGGERESSKYFRTGFALHARPAHLLHAHACQFAIPGVGISDT